MENKTCTVRKIEKDINNFYKNYPGCKDCNIKRDVKRYFDNKDKISIQQKTYYEKIEINYYKNKTITETKETQYKELFNPYVELQNKLKALEEKVKNA